MKAYKVNGGGEKLGRKPFTSDTRTSRRALREPSRKGRQETRSIAGVRYS